MAWKVDSQSPPQCCNVCVSKDAEMTTVYMTHHGHALAASVSSPREEDSLALATTALDQIEHDLVVLRRVEIMHAVRVGTVMVQDTGVRNAFRDCTEVRLCLEY